MESGYATVSCRGSFERAGAMERGYATWGAGPAVEHRRAADLCVPSAALREVVAEAGIGGRQRPCGAFCGEEFDSYGRMGEGSRALTGWRMSRRAWRAGPTGPLGPLLFPRSHAASFLCYGD